MSLINQMLRDLEQRNNPTPKLTPINPKNIPLMREQAHSRTHSLGLIIGLLSLAAGWLIWDRASQLDAKPDLASAKVEATIPTNDGKKETQAMYAEPVIEEQTLPETKSPDEQIAAPQQAALAIAPIPAATVQAKNQEPAPATITPKANIKPKVAAKPSDNKPIKPRRNSAEALYRQADNSASRMMRKENLREVLDIDPRHLPARQKLLGLLLQERSTLELKTFLNDSLALFPTHLGFISALARYQIQQKDFSGAIATLERVDNFTINDFQYLSLLAASYQQQQFYTKALPIYQKLSQLQPDKAENWLGLGICADKLQQPSSAARAYQRALQRNSLSNEVVDYIKQRLSALNY